MGSSCVLPYMGKDMECMVSRKKCSHELWCANDLAWVERSPWWLLFLSEWLYRLYCSKEKETHCQSAIRPVENSENLPVLKPPDLEMQLSSSADEHSGGECEEPNDPENKNKQIPFPRKTLNDLGRYLYLTKEKIEFIV